MVEVSSIGAGLFPALYSLCISDITIPNISALRYLALHHSFDTQLFRYKILHGTETASGPAFSTD